MKSKEIYINLYHQIISPFDQNALFAPMDQETEEYSLSIKKCSCPSIYYAWTTRGAERDRG